MDLTNIEKLNFTYHGIYRGVIEDNDDPLGAGRVKIRIFGMWDDESIEIKDLPWAEPALGLAWSGGYNLRNEDWPGGKPIANKGAVYSPGSNSKVAGSQSSALSYKEPAENKQQETDPFMNACGTGGQFVTPKRGNWVFCFFEGGNPMRPIYFAMAPSARDWKTQSEALRGEVVQKIAQIGDFKKDIALKTNLADTKDKKVEAQLKTDTPNWADTALVSSKVSAPKMTITDIPADSPNRDIFSITSPNGTTLIMDNRNGNEKFYIIHKNTIEHIDDSGNKKVYIGKSHGRNSGFTTETDANKPSNYELSVEGDHEVHILGKYKLFVNGDIGIKSLGNIQIESANNVGISVTSGDVDLIVKDGSVNAKIAGNLNANVSKSANIKVKKQCNVLAQDNMNLTTLKNLNINAATGIKMSTAGAMELQCASINITAPQECQISTLNTKIGGNVNVVGEMTCNLSLNTGQDVVCNGFVYAGAGLSSSGILNHAGIARIGGPTIIHGLTVLPGSASPTTRPSKVAEPPIPVAIPADIAIPSLSIADRINYTAKLIRSVTPDLPI